MYELKVTSGFAAAHRLTMVGAKCENLHGHNWKVEVILQGDRLDEGGVLLDFGVVKTRLREVMATLDHKFLNDLPMFAGAQPSSERIATYVAEELRRAINTACIRVSRVNAWESEDACATYIID